MNRIIELVHGCCGPDLTDLTDLTHAHCAGPDLTGGGQPPHASQISHKSKPTMGNKASAPALPAAGGECKKSDKVGIKSGKKICCCCPETKQARDECVVFKGEGEWNHRVHNVCRKHSTYNCTGAEFYFIRGARRLSEERSCFGLTTLIRLELHSGVGLAFAG